MRVYFVVFFLTFVAQFFPVKTEKQYWFRTIISFVPLFLFMSLRQDYGADESAYHWYYDMIHKVSWSEIFGVSDHMENGYAILNKFMPTYQLLIAFISFLTCWAYSYLIYKFVPSSYSWLAVILLFSVPSLTVYFMISGIRNGIAASLFVLSTYYIEKRKIIPFAIITAIAMSIHTSALFIFVICYIIGTNKLITGKQMVFLIAGMVSLSVASLALLAQNAMPFIELFMDQYVGQVEGLAEIADERGTLGALVGLIFGVGILLYLYMMGNTSRKSILLTTELGSIKYKYAMLFAASFTIGVLGGRMGQYWIYFFNVAVTCMTAYWTNKLYKLGFLLIVLFYYRIQYVMMISNPDFEMHYRVYTSILGSF